MNPRQRITSLLANKAANRPVFCPAIYEHKARLIGRSCSDTARSADLLCEAVLQEYDLYRPDMLTVGLDIYNIEAEALGAQVTFSDKLDAVPTITGKLLDTLSAYNQLKTIDIQKSERMPLMLEAAGRVYQKIGQEVFVRGAITAPFSMAAELVGIEPLLISAIMDPQTTAQMLDFCLGISIAYGKAFLKQGVQVCVFDSQSSPPLVSPDMYGELILPRVRTLVKELKAAGAIFVEYVAGGNTTANAANLFGTGSDIILSDFISQADVFLNIAKSSNKIMRRNISAVLVENGDCREIENEVKNVMSLLDQYGGVIVGTGVLAYNTDPEKIKFIRNLL